MSTEKKSFSKRVLSAALAAVMAVPMLTATAFAVDRSQIRSAGGNHPCRTRVEIQPAP